jgi:anti-sigma-K factor RskA
MTERTHLDPRSSDDDLLTAVRALPAANVAEVEPPADLWDRIAAAAADTAPVAGSADGGGAVVVPLRRRARLPILGAAAAAVAVFAVGVVAMTRGGDQTTELASAQLEALTDAAAPGDATLVDGGDGLVLRVDVDAEPAEGEFLELWLIDEAVTQPISLGRYTGAGDYAVPTGLDPAAFPVVDISTEPDDGDSSHSGASVSRGALDL